jgi:hypothetical protein
VEAESDYDTHEDCTREMGHVDLRTQQEGTGDDKTVSGIGGGSLEGVPLGSTQMSNQALALLYFGNTHVCNANNTRSFELTLIKLLHGGLQVRSSLEFHEPTQALADGLRPF